MQDQDMLVGIDMLVLLAVACLLGCGFFYLVEYLASWREKRRQRGCMQENHEREEEDEQALPEPMPAWVAGLEDRLDRLGKIGDFEE